MRLRDFTLELLNRLTRKLHDDPAMRANDVVVVLVFVSVLESSKSVLELDGLGQLCVAEEFQCSINRRSPNLGMCTLNDLVELIDRRVTFGVEKELENDFALPGMLEIVLGKITFENFVLFSKIGPFSASHFGQSPSPNFSQYIYFFRHRFLEGELSLLALEDERRPPLMEFHRHTG